MEFYNYLISVYPILGIELLAGIVGLVYLRYKKPQRSDVVFVSFLWFTFFIELFAGYSPIGYFSDYKYFGFIEGTIFERNTWMYNISAIVGYIMLINCFKWNLISPSRVRLINLMLWVFGITSILNLVIFNIFFTAVSVFTVLAGTMLLLFAIASYQLQLLQSDEILNFGKLLPFYISIGATIFNLCLVPFAIYGKFWEFASNPDFVSFRSNAFLIVNLVVYSIYIFGFTICLKKKS